MVKKLCILLALVSNIAFAADTIVTNYGDNDYGDGDEEENVDPNNY